MTLLSVSGMRIRFGHKEVVKGIDFSIAPGEKLALVGESGSGKTVTALSLLGLLGNGRCAGSVKFTGTHGTQDLFSLSEEEMRAIRGQEIAMIFQEPMTALNPLFTIGNQIAEVVQIKLGLNPAQAAKATIELLEKTGMPEPARRANAFPHQLSGGQRQRAMIAMALACKPRLLLADEPTTALDVSVRAQILDLLQDLQRETGMAVLMITHDLNLVRKFADRVAVMESGHLVESGSVAEVFSSAQHPYTRKLIDSQPTRDPLEATAKDGPTLLEAKDVQVQYPIPIAGWRGWFKKGSFTAVHQASFAIGVGRTLGVIGESGSGKSSLALAVLGLHPHSGTIRFDGQHWGKDKVSDTSLRRHLQVVFQDPFSSLSPRMTVEEIVGEGLLVHHPSLGLAQRQQRVLATLAEVGLTEAQFPNLLARYPHEFSGGQRQRVAIARALIVDPRLLVLDEPTSALDVTIQKQVLSLLQALQRQRGLSYLLITHDVAVIRAMAHYVLVMKDGQVVEMGPMHKVLDASQHNYTQTLIAAST
jgi:microcin C transport system ATP-binding protein